MDLETFAKDEQHFAVLDAVEKEITDPRFDYAVFDKGFDRVLSIHNDGKVYEEFRFEPYDLDDCWAAFHNWVDDRSE